MTPHKVTPFRFPAQGKNIIKKYSELASLRVFAASCEKLKSMCHPVYHTKARRHEENTAFCVPKGLRMQNETVKLDAL